MAQPVHAVAAQFAGGVSAPEDIAGLLPDSLELRPLLSALEKALIERALRSTGGAQAEAARRLGLSRSDLSYKLAKFRIKNPAQ